MRFRWTAVGGLLLFVLTAAAATMQGPDPHFHEDNSDPGPPQPAGQGDLALPHQNDPASPQPANKAALTGGITNTTTMDPLEEYCKEACEVGIGGAMCDCPEHPIG